MPFDNNRLTNIPLVSYSSSSSSDDLVVQGHRAECSEELDSSNIPEVIILSDDDNEDDTAICEPPRVAANLRPTTRVGSNANASHVQEGITTRAGNVYQHNRIRMQSYGVRGSVDLYTPLQKWEYEHGLPVDGVSHVRAWALEVGLAEEDDEETQPQKKRKCARLNEPSKYGESSTIIDYGEPSNPIDIESEAAIQPPVVQQDKTNEVTDAVEKDNKEVACVCKGKGKEPMKEQQRTQQCVSPLFYFTFSEMCKDVIISLFVISCPWLE